MIIILFLTLLLILWKRPRWIYWWALISALIFIAAMLISPFTDPVPCDQTPFIDQACPPGGR